MEQKEPEKKMPSMHANAKRRSANESLESIHFNAQSAFFFTHGMVSMAQNRWFFSTGSLMY